MNNTHSNQQKDEREIVKNFLKTAGIKTQSNGIQSHNPPYPDVLCSLLNGRTIAFELTRTLDPNLARNRTFSDNVAIEMRNYFDNMSSSDGKKLRNTFDNADLYVKFDNGINKSKFKKLLPDLFKTLLKCSSDTKGAIEKELLFKGVKQIRVVRGTYIDGPMFNVSGTTAQYIADKTIDCIKAKFKKSHGYKCDCPMELLVHSGSRRLPPKILWLPDVHNYVAQQLSSSLFQRVWIFDCVESKIRYVYPYKPINLGDPLS